MNTIQPLNLSTVTLRLNYRDPYNWVAIRDFLAKRAISEVEIILENSYQRNFHWKETHGFIEATISQDQQCFEVSIKANRIDQLENVVANLRRVLDLDSDSQIISQHLINAGVPENHIQPGIRLPGVWSVFEAGCRAILGQQISLTASVKLLNRLVELSVNREEPVLCFPTPQQVALTPLDQLKMPESRKKTIAAFAKYMVENPDGQNPDNWISIKGIGPWTIAYAKMRGASDPNIWLATDLVIKKINLKLDLDTSKADPWCSYLTIQLWNMA